jgi:1-acyl-sn-glycerol-3-phosphate acyltransferase
LLFFPEGKFYRMPGLHKFHLGAFIAAVDAGVPVVPITLRGTRSKFRADSWFPHQGGMSITIGKPIGHDGDDWGAAVRLRDTARAEILRQCGEPNLGQDDSVF